MERLNESRIGAVITEAFAVRASTATESTLHAQHGAALLVGLDGEVTVTEPGRASVRGRVVVVPPHLPHAVASPGPTLGLLYDPELAAHVASYSRGRGGAFPLEGRLAERLGAALTAHRASLSRPDVLAGLAREYADWLSQESPRAEPDARIARVLEALRTPEADWRLAAARTRLSLAHLRALFVRDVGVPIRTFQLWRRLLVAVAASSRLDATSAAHLAGFADLAHFSRTCRRMLGYSPTALRGGLLS
ncbi:AraC-like DNA-binding protein [Archangium gephyra]|uniref:AraC-like DNA-binding protein n=1 Tax=Archangium gephyra TaxID=48 RepID=A0AAC8Q4T1_9BACT|nr:AraC family transcriptional regulator [Archangium gephyra]AKJ00989.1 Transcriptional regulator, AraC family [Archangium gephyra]REG26153.1 AraC-like DNA-binding protein [Archangium gephyra]